MKDLAFFTMVVSFVLAALGAPAWGWFLLAALLFGAFA